MTKPVTATVFEHLDELRKRLIVSLLAISACTLGCFFYADKILALLALPIRSQIGEVYFFSPAGAFVVKLKVAVLSGFFMASPIVLGQLWAFVSPALYPRERKLFVPLVILTSFLFISGGVFSFVAVLPLALKFLVGMQTEFLKPMISMSEYLSFLAGMLLSFGVAFNLPVFVLAAVSSGVVSAATLNRFQRHVILLIFVLAAVLTPGPDVASQLLLALPLVVLFELSVLAALGIDFARRKKRSKQLAHD